VKGVEAVKVLRLGGVKVWKCQGVRCEGVEASGVSRAAHLCLGRAVGGDFRGEQALKLRECCVNYFLVAFACRGPTRHGVS
jgi:hypothetical protein